MQKQKDIEMRKRTLRLIKAGVINMDEILKMPADCRDPK